MNKRNLSNWFLGLSALFFVTALVIPKATFAQLPWPNECSTGCCWCHKRNICSSAQAGFYGFSYCVSGNHDCGYAGTICAGGTVIEES